MSTITSPLPCKDRVAELANLASAKEAIKDYESAADLYSQAAQLQAEINGEMAIENVDLLYSYGKCLYHVAVNRSDVFGSMAAVQDVVEKAKSPPKELSDRLESPPLRDEQSASSGLQHRASAASDSNLRQCQDSSASQAYFQFTGDENFEDEDDEENQLADCEPSDEIDDFENAFETLDMARVLLLRKLDDLSQSSGGGKDSAKLATIRSVKERLSDIYDLQAEISLEGERFPAAVADLRAALKLKRELFPPEDSIVAECHYKLSLALEFSSLSDSSDENGHSTLKVDSQLREEAAKHMETAIQSCNLRISKEEHKLVALEDTNTEEFAKVKRQVEDVKEIVSDMKLRLAELLKPPISIKNSSTNTDGDVNENTGQVQSPSSKKRLEEAMKDANDLSALVRKRKRVSPNDTDT
ncbi:hypothetical protein PRK78_001049 [Emydomyces testavorans]|uniref:Tetratricopeptide SHNi-TPR domain-containing protein n=1 Tax=Emydomyces testavorans TaxID=2070801 RepID=A0AAF0IGE7_9EURO|nr:hypothetical protein PRK78_001049 [Emydomyces testavorans]